MPHRTPSSNGGLFPSAASPQRVRWRFAFIREGSKNLFGAYRLSFVQPLGRLHLPQAQGSSPHSQRLFPCQNDNHFHAASERLGAICTDSSSRRHQTSLLHRYTLVEPFIRLGFRVPSGIYWDIGKESGKYYLGFKV